MLEKHELEAKKIMGEINCPKEFVCYESGLKILCSARDVGIDSFLECLERNPTECKFAFPFGLTHLCKCPLRVYIAKEINQ
jgi:hypothetical protein